MSEFEFYRETNLKEVELNGRRVKIPEEWKIEKLGALLLLLRNGLTKRQNKLGNGYPVTRIETIANECINPDNVGYVENVTPIEIEKYRLIPGDILFSHINSLEHIGKTAIYEGKPKLLLHGMNLLLIRANPTKIYPYYLLMILRFYRAKSLFRNIAKKAVNQASINQTELKKLEIPLPPLEEQKEIASVLRTIDEAIQAVDESIAKLERLKRGAMEELLTKGIGHTKFKEVELNGRRRKIPEEWELTRLEEISEAMYYGVTAKAVSEKTGFKMLRTTDISNYKVSWKHLPFCEITEAKKDINKYTLKKGDLIIARAGTVGVSVVVPMDLPDTIFGSYLIKVVLIKDKVIPEFVHYYLQSSFYWEQIKKTAAGGVLKNINLPILRKIKLPLPPLPEQKKIAEILRTIDEAIETKRQKKEKLERMKRAVMEKLLTGEIRIR